MSMQNVPPSFDELSQEQLAIYAHEFRDIYVKTRHLHARLNEREAEIEQKSREVAALNRMLQEHLREWRQLADTYRAIARELKQALQNGGMPNVDRLSQLLDGAIGDGREPLPVDASEG